MNARSGFTLLEVILATAVLLVVSLLGYLVLRGSTEAYALAETRSEVQASLRNAMTTLSSELREAYTERTIDQRIAPAGAESIVVEEEGKRVTFMRPVPVVPPNEVDVSPRISFYYEVADETAPILNGRVIREEDGVQQVAGSANHISDVEFELLPSVNSDSDYPGTLRVRLESTRGYGPNNKYQFTAALETRIPLEN